MLLLILGVVLLVVGYAINSPSLAFAKFARPIKFVGVAFVLLGFLGSIVHQIDAGKVGVQSLFGNVKDEVLTSGLNVVNPLVEVREVDIQTRNYTMSAVHDEGDKAGDDAIRVLSSDGLEVGIDNRIVQSPSKSSS